jgi:OmpA-OmpF porin, OOP family
MRSLHWAVCSIVGLLAGTARAAEDGFYIGAAGGDTETQLQTGVGEIYDDQDTSFKVIGGWRPFDWFALEGGYFDLGNVTLHEPVPGLAPFRLEQKGYDFFGVFLIEIVNFDLFAKAGVVKSSADLTTSLSGGQQASSVDQDTDFAWGAGVQVRFRKLAARIEYESLHISNGYSLEPPTIFSFGITWTF